MPSICQKGSQCWIMLKTYLCSRESLRGKSHKHSTLRLPAPRAQRAQALGFLAAGISGTVLKRWLPAPGEAGLSGTMAYLSAGGT